MSVDELLVTRFNGQDGPYLVLEWDGHVAKCVDQKYKQITFFCHELEEYNGPIRIVRKKYVPKIIVDERFVSKDTLWDDY